MADGTRGRGSEGGGERPPPDGRAASARKPFLLRLPADLHDEIRAWAEQDLRSVNGQIEFLLREAVRRRRGR